VTLFGPVAGKTVIDLCAAPGGKTAQLAAAGARVTAVDRSAKRLERLTANLARLGLAAQTVTAEATQWRPPAPADSVLLDAPCSATGTIRRHPDVAWLKTPEDMAKLADLQARLLTAAVAMVRPGGILIYCTCSLQPEEGPQQIARLLDGRAAVERVPVTAAEVGGLVELITADGDLRTLPCHLPDQGGLDGFYAARLRKL
jgi:16S rRNA (cytosine967-C5)-methyltransferase